MTTLELIAEIEHMQHGLRTIAESADWMHTNLAHTAKSVADSTLEKLTQLRGQLVVRPNLKGGVE